MSNHEAYDGHCKRCGLRSVYWEESPECLGKPKEPARMVWVVSVLKGTAGLRYDGIQNIFDNNEAASLQADRLRDDGLKVLVSSYYLQS